VPAEEPRCLERTPEIHYRKLHIKSVANVARIDINGFPSLQSQMGIETEIKDAPKVENRGACRTLSRKNPEQQDLLGQH